MSDRDYDRKEAEFTLTVNECEHLRRSTCKSSTRRPKQFLLEISTQWRLVWNTSRLKFGKISSRLLLQIYSQCGSVSIHCIADPSSVSSPDSTKCRHPSTAFHHPIWANISIDVSGSGTAVLYYSHVMPSGWLHNAIYICYLTTFYPRLPQNQKSPLHILIVAACCHWFTLEAQNRAEAVLESSWCAKYPAFDRKRAGSFHIKLFNMNELHRIALQLHDLCNLFQTYPSPWPWFADLCEAPFSMLGFEWCSISMIGFKHCLSHIIGISHQAKK